MELTEQEINEIDNLRKSKLSVRKIARLIKRSKSAVYNYLSRGTGTKARERSGRPALLDEHFRRRIWREASNNGSNCSQIKKTLQLDCSTDIILKCVHQNSDLTFKKMLTRPQLTDQHKATRVAWCIPRLLWNEEWHHYVFTDEKKFNLDGPDGWAYYWHDKRKPEQIFSKRQHGGGSVMVWAGFGYSGSTPIMFISGRLNSERYIEVLRDQFSPYFDQCAVPPAVFQQDNASIHASHRTTQWLNENFNWENNWPSKSPDLNIMENMWAILSREVYMNNKHYRTVAELKLAIVRCWAAITQETRQKLVNSMPGRMVKVIAGDGASINV